MNEISFTVVQTEQDLRKALYRLYPGTKLFRFSLLCLFAVLFGFFINGFTTLMITVLFVFVLVPVFMFEHNVMIAKSLGIEQPRHCTFNQDGFGAETVNWSFFIKWPQVRPVMPLKNHLKQAKNSDFQIYP